MMATVETPVNCSTCESINTGKKIKLGILLCNGCRSRFCSAHMMEHRVYLNNLLDNAVVNQINELNESIALCNEHGYSLHNTEQLSTINKWESDSIEMIKQTAVLARKRLEHLAIEHFDTVNKTFKMLSAQVHSIMDDESFFENDINQLEQKFQKLKDGFENFPVEIKTKTFPDTLIDVRFMAKITADSMLSPNSFLTATQPDLYFIDKLLARSKLKKSIDLSQMKPGEILPMNDRLIGFALHNQISTLDPKLDSWMSIPPIPAGGEMYWFDHLQVILYFQWSNRYNTPHKLFQFDPKSLSRTEVLPKSSSWKRGANDDFDILTCFKQYIVIVMQDKIEQWSAHGLDWYTKTDAVIRWYPPVAWRPGTHIEQICMNDTNYAILIRENCDRGRQTVIPFEFEIRNRAMSVLHYIPFEPCISDAQMRLCSLPKRSGWLFFAKMEKVKCCYIINKDGKQHKQNFVETSDIEDAVVFGDSIVIRRVDCNKNTDIISIYDWEP